MSYFPSADKAKRESYYLVPETCPAVDDALLVLVSQIEDGERPDVALALADGKIKAETNALRAALTSSLTEKIEAQSALEKAESEIEDLKRQIENLKADNRDLEIENDKLDQKLAAAI